MIFFHWQFFIAKNVFFATTAEATTSTSAATTTATAAAADAQHPGISNKEKFGTKKISWKKSFLGKEVLLRKKRVWCHLVGCLKWRFPSRWWWWWHLQWSFSFKLRLHCWWLWWAIVTSDFDAQCRYFVGLQSSLVLSHFWSWTKSCKDLIGCKATKIWVGRLQVRNSVTARNFHWGISVKNLIDLWFVYTIPIRVRDVLAVHLLYKKKLECFVPSENNFRLLKRSGLVVPPDADGAFEPDYVASSWTTSVVDHFKIALFGQIYKFYWIFLPILPNDWLRLVALILKSLQTTLSAGLELDLN